MYLSFNLSTDIFDLYDALSVDTTTAPPRKPENQECPNIARDLVLLIDGSSSIRSVEFLSQKLFVALFSKTFLENTLFSLLQFSNKIQEHFDFRSFQNDRNLHSILQEARQLHGSSHTATAIRKAVEQFTPQKGARSNAKRFPVIVTDGEKTGDPLDYAEVVQEADRARITRFAVGHSLCSSAESLLADPETVSTDLPGSHQAPLMEGGVAEKFACNLDSISIASFSSLAPSSGHSIRRRRPPSPETCSIASSTRTLVPETIYLPPAGYQLVSESEWAQLQEQVQQQRGTLEERAKEKANLEEALRCSNEECSKQVQVLLAQIQTSENLLQSLQATVSETQRQTQEQIADLAASHKRLSYEVQRLNAENEGLRGMSSQNPLPTDDETRSLPSTVPELQAMVSKLRQESALQLRAAEHQAERLRIEIISLQERLDEEAASQSSLQGALEREREERELLQASLNSIQSEMERLQQGQEELNRIQMQPDVREASRLPGRPEA
ncbi:rab GTPase-binding effector protein 2-like [Protobothrops mucrosquamatus]|uniref:rab GTPase-binding effector protein 2-like n=1 Tax=Protobothrops mucrosquamatus TaxID=103944 RepID=UPI00077577CF|nr:rab GTPase-binding effector protein 2-like [Protobothrops mucrosquamatus]